MNRNLAEKKLTVDFQIDHVKKCINETLTAGAGTYISPTRNDILGSYGFKMSQGLHQGETISITVSPVQENKTEINITCKNLAGSIADDAVLERFLNEYLNILSMSLSGQAVTKETIKKNTSGCLGVVLFIVASSLAMAGLFL